MPDYQKIIDKYYPEGLPLRDIYLRHCRQVADKALAIASAKGLQLDPADIEAAAMLHDIGIFLTDASGIQCHGAEPYLRHGLLGADLLRREATAPLAEVENNVDSSEKQTITDWYETMARVAERHTGSGISREDIIADDLPLPLDRTFLPETLLERLICYADKFYSKSGTMAEKPLPKVLVSMTHFGPASYTRFLSLHKEFS